MGSVCMGGSVPPRRPPGHRCDHLTAPRAIGENRRRGRRRSSLVGRAREREAIARRARALRAGAAVVVIEGEPGIGKSRLLAHLASEAAAAGAAVLAARGRREYEADLPLRRCWRATALGGESARPAPARATATRAHRALRERSSGSRRARPLVLCLDDVHWADPASLDALAALVRRPPAGRVLLALAAARRASCPRPLARRSAARGARPRVTRSRSRR